MNQITISSVLYQQLITNATVCADYFQTEEVLNICISVQNQIEIFVSYLSAAYCQSQFLLFVCFSSMAKLKVNLTNFQLLIISLRNLCQR